MKEIDIRRNSKSSAKELVDILSPSLDEEKVLSKIDLGSLWQWILCLSIVNFDLELGHKLELAFPPIPFNEAEQRTLCCSSFPDSNSADHSGDSVFSFRMRNGEFTRNLYLKQAQSCSFADDEALEVANSMGLPIDNDGFTYGYVFFRQQRDDNIRRGYFQKALVLLTPHSWPGLFLHIVSKLGNRIMNRTSTSDLHFDLESACLEISLWFGILIRPSPPSSWSSERIFHSIDIPAKFFEDELIICFPPDNNFPQCFKTRTRSQTLAQPVTQIICNPSKLYQIFCKSLDILWPCWELLTLGEPIIVMSDSPTSCSEVVLALIELIKPMQYGGDYRPYFTIQDSDFASMTGKGRTPTSAIILGITNQVFSKVLESWPHIIYAGKPKIAKYSDPSNIEFSDSFVEKCSFKHRPYFSKDKRLLKTVLEASMSGKSLEPINNILRNHFSELTQRFLQPINRYFESLIVGNPATMSLSNLRLEPEISPFKQDEFLGIIDNSAPSLPLFSKRPLIDFYRAFLKSPNFASWLRQKTNEVYRNWRSHYLDLLCTSNLSDWLLIHGSDSMVETIDLLMRVRDELTNYASFFVIENDSVHYAYISIKTVDEKENIEIANNEKLESVEIHNWNDGEVDLGSIVTGSSYSNPKHIKAKTAPLPSKSWIALENNDINLSPPTISQSALLNTSIPFDTNPSEFVKNLKKSGQKQKNVFFGEFIPSVEQYSKLMSQANILINSLPQELRSNI